MGRRGLPFLHSGLHSSPTHTSAVYWREPGEQVHIQVSWGFSSVLSKSMTRTSGLRPPWNKGSLVQSNSALRVESRASSSCWGEPGDICRQNKWGLEKTVDFSTSLEKWVGRWPVRHHVQAISLELGTWELATLACM